MDEIVYYFKKQIGKTTYSFSVKGKNLHEVIMESQKLSFPNQITHCAICGSDNIELGAHDTPNEGHEYTYVRCRNCRATLNFGQQKKSNDVYYLRTKEGKDQHGNPIKIYDWKPYENNN